MADTTSAQLYAQLAALLAPPGSVEGTTSLVILEPAGKDVAPLGAGTPEAIEALADLANTVPLAGSTFLDSGGVYDDIWRFVLRSATPTGGPDDPARVTLATLISDNRADLELMARARLDVPGDTFHPVLAEPRGWLDDDGWAEASFRIGGDAPQPPPATPPSVFTPTDIPQIEWRLIEPVEPVEPVPDPRVVPDRMLRPEREAVADAGEEPGGWRLSGLADRLRSPVVLRSKAAGVADLAVLPTESGGDADVAAELAQPLVLRADAVSSLQRLRATPAARLAPEEPVNVVLDAGTRWKDVWTAARVIDTTAPIAAPDVQGSGFELRFQFRVVGIKRPWIQQQLLRLRGWSVPGLGAGGISTGDPTGNTGLMPVLTTRMLVVRRLVVTARWSDADRARAARSAALAFGPFTLTGGDAFDGSELTREGPQVVAWLGQVLPASPPE